MPGLRVGNCHVTAGHGLAISRPFWLVIGCLTCPPDDCIVDLSNECRPVRLALAVIEKKKVKIVKKRCSQ